MSTRPSFQFYPADWRSNGNLSICTFAAQGVWMRCLCIFHDADEYGLARWPLKKIAKSIGCRQQTLHELATNQVLKGADENFPGFWHRPNRSGVLGEPVLLIPPCDGSCWYSSRMVIDEWRRTQRGGATRFSAENQPTDRLTTRRVVRSQAASQPDGLLLRVVNGPSSSSSVKTLEVETLTDRDTPVVTFDHRAKKSRNGANGHDLEFERFWNVCPRKIGKGQARRAFTTALKKTGIENLIATMQAYAASRMGEDANYTVHPSTWLNGERWADVSGDPESDADRRAAEIVARLNAH